jgi:hypothetical protein
LGPKHLASIQVVQNQFPVREKGPSHGLIFVYGRVKWYPVLYQRGDITGLAYVRRPEEGKRHPQQKEEHC